MKNDLETILGDSYMDLLELYDTHDRAFKKSLGTLDYTEPRFYDTWIRNTLDLLGALIITKADAEVYQRFKGMS